MNGVLLVDKPSGVTSHDVVAQARRALGTRNIGHAGTLDPLASGLLVLLVNEATKISDFLLTGDKGYEVGVKLGVRTDSMDVTGQILSTSTVCVSPEEIRAQALALSGELELEVPVHSAVKVSGKKLYEFAHKGERPDVIPRRKMRFYDVNVQNVEAESVSVRLKCSKGSFVRAWAQQLGEVLGTGGTVESLRRTYSAPFSIERALKISEIQEKPRETWGDAWIPLSESLPHFSRLDVGGRDETLLKNGQISKSLETELLRFVSIGESLPAVRVISRESQDLLALLMAGEDGGFYRIRRVFNTSSNRLN